MGAGGRQHNFREDLTWSLDQVHQGFWLPVYEKAFPDFESMNECSDLEWQRRGVDRIIHLTSGKTIYIDEKYDRTGCPRIALEFISVDTTGAPGWIEKDLHIDYLAYGFVDKRQCFLLPWQALRRVWKKHGELWKKWGRKDFAGFKTRPVNNGDYTTWIVATPIGVLRKHIAQALTVQL